MPWRLKRPIPATRNLKSSKTLLVENSPKWPEKIRPSTRSLQRWRKSFSIWPTTTTTTPATRLATTTMLAATTTKIHRAWALTKIVVSILRNQHLSSSRRNFRLANLWKLDIKGGSSGNERHSGHKRDEFESQTRGSFFSHCCSCLVVTLNSVFISYRYCISQPICPHRKFIFGPKINVWEQGLFSFIDYNSAILYLGRSAWSWNWMFLTGVFEVLILKEIRSVYNHSSHKPQVLPWWRCFFRSWISKHRRWRSYFYPTLLLKSLASIPVGQFCAR